MKPTEILNPAQRQKSKTYLVNKLRDSVFSWRNQGYEGATDTTKRLLQFWFNEDHLINRELFSFWFCQQEAIESLIYIYEVVKKRNFIDLAREFGAGPVYGYDPLYDQYPLYAFKMATGSGKTFVMAMTVIWSYFNHKIENKRDYTTKILLIAPNLIVYDRLKRDFQNGVIFKEFPFIPNEWQKDFNLQIILREDPIHTIPEDVLFLTNIQQLEERKSKVGEIDGYVDHVFELPEAYNVKNIAPENRIREVLSSCPNIMILKDEAHHIYNFEKSWKKILVQLNEDLLREYDKGINTELDFSATPKTETGALFPWIISDFGLKEAIEMNIVKLPLKGIVKQAREMASEKAHERYRVWIDAGVRRWREYKESLSKLNRKPILFVMCEDTEAADDVFYYLNNTSDLKGKVLLIHTRLNGEIVKEDLDQARQAARLIDEPNNPYDAIVSVMMLNEGWDVKTVTVIVGIRAFTSKRKVLPEQVIGRGLRKMFPEEESNTKNSVNILEVIGPPGITEILEELERQEGIKFQEFEIGIPINLLTIFVDENKFKMDFEIPQLTPRIIKREPVISELTLEKLPYGNKILEKKIYETEYIAKHILTNVEIVRRKWNLPVPQDSRSVIAYYTNKILKELRIPITSNFEKFYPLLKGYVTRRLFVDEVDIDDPRLLFNLSDPVIEEFIVNTFVNVFRDLTYTEIEPREKEFIRLSEVSPFTWTKSVYPANRCILNYVPCDSNFEVDFAKFLDTAHDVKRFIKNTTKIGFYLEYISEDNLLRFYYPDFVVENMEDEYFLVETKGLKDLEVKHKDERAKKWCEDISSVTGKTWQYIRIDQDIFERQYYSNLIELFEVCKT